MGDSPPNDVRRRYARPGECEIPDSVLETSAFKQRLGGELNPERKAPAAPSRDLRPNGELRSSGELSPLRAKPTPPAVEERLNGDPNQYRGSPVTVSREPSFSGELNSGRKGPAASSRDLRPSGELRPSAELSPLRAKPTILAVEAHLNGDPSQYRRNPVTVSREPNFSGELNPILRNAVPLAAEARLRVDPNQTMSASASVRSAVPTRNNAERGHRTRLFLAWMLALAVVLVVGGYGYDYYTLSAAQRPFSPKHDILRPSGTIGIQLGMVGVLMFFLIYLYPLRKKWGWLGRQGNSRHWLDFHIVLGTTAPIIIAFHSSFKFGNIAGMAFWSMMMVTLSGFVGRYLYSQIPRSLNAAELSMREMQDKEAALRKELAEQRATFGFSTDALYQLPSAADVAKTPAIASLISMIFIDFKRPFKTSLVRLQQAGFLSWIFSFFGLLPTRNHGLERAIRVAKAEAKLSKSIAFLSRTQRIFQLWHVIHRPFSYAFAIMAIIHIALALFMGYRV